MVIKKLFYGSFARHELGLSAPFLIKSKFEAKSENLNV